MPKTVLWPCRLTTAATTTATATTATAAATTTTTTATTTSTTTMTMVHHLSYSTADQPSLPCRNSCLPEPMECHQSLDTETASHTMADPGDNTDSQAPTTVTAVIHV